MVERMGKDVCVREKVYRSFISSRVYGPFERTVRRNRFIRTSSFFCLARLLRELDEPFAERPSLGVRFAFGQVRAPAQLALRIRTEMRPIFRCRYGVHYFRVHCYWVPSARAQPVPELCGSARSSSMRRSWLYFATGSVREAEPVLI